MATEIQQILHELKSIKEELHYIKGHMVDVATLLTVEEKQKCFDYIFSYLSFWYSPSKTEALCNEVGKELRSFCREEAMQALEWKRNN